LSQNLFALDLRSFLKTLSTLLLSYKRWWLSLRWPLPCCKYVSISCLSYDTRIFWNRSCHVITCVINARTLKLIVFIAFKVTMQLDEVMNAMRYMFLVISQLIHLFCYSLQGQKLIDHSVQMRDKMWDDDFNCCWKLDDYWRTKLLQI